ncbi:hypothetical protein [Halobacillus karajensis]|uniref:DUF4367 domain-containing protein n=1 Tax=Halobacillus karajensis TaxID=195088 RepID=A0A024P7G5_9BACI|nr:hypothetical protein [Halobacillus karajensis]CDQ20258.1 hypothetical protein BN982_02581 [Halobacillus karajensis]CDQ25079.1 hypothetical protein BN983_03384 [Halobacillus karajensis]CDQ28560.1 hypothetical protein BN981_02868 [Halobacillus karajensis]
MRKQFWIILLISISVFIVGCAESNGESTDPDQKISTQNEEEISVEGHKIILVGTPNFNGEGPSMNMDQEISDSTRIVKVEDVMGTAKKIEKPLDKVNGAPDVFFTITKSGGTKQDTLEERRFIWYQEDGSAVLLADGSGEYYSINSSQAKELKEALNK